MLDQGGLESPIIFPNFMQHVEVASRFSGQVVSAGFVQLYVENGKLRVHAYGESHSLGLKARDRDSGILDRALQEPEW